MFLQIICLDIFINENLCCTFYVCNHPQSKLLFILISLIKYDKYKLDEEMHENFCHKLGVLRLGETPK